MAGPSFKIKNDRSSWLKAPAQSKSSSGLGQLMAYMMAQSQGQAQEQAMPGAIPIRGTSKVTGVTSVTPEEQNLAVSESLRKKASDDALAIGNVLPMFQELSDLYSRATSQVTPSEGLKGGAAMLKEYGTGVVGRGNEDLRKYEDTLKLYQPKIRRIMGDVGNQTIQEQMWSGKAFPIITPNTDISRAFMPDDPNYGSNKMKNIMNLLGKAYEESKRVAETGELSPGYSNFSKQSTSPLPGSKNYQAAGVSEKIRVRNKITGQTGSITASKFNADKYERI